MASITVPYSEGMRIGMGFNSYTQKLCTNDVVRRPGGKSATEADLRPVNISTGVPTQKGPQGQILDGSGGGASVRKLSDGQLDISQLVQWQASFVNKASDVSSSLGISGALQVNIDAAGIKGEVNASYMDAKVSSGSDALYSITVKVVNQKSVAEDVTVFTPIPNIPESKFTEVYGDCFISGFLEGGLLNALISKKMKSESESMSISGQLKANMDLKVVQASADIKGEYKDSKAENNVETAVQVQWSGGGDIKPDSVHEWDIPTLIGVAMEFPDRVAVCPQKTFAILTKYTALRSFHEQTIKGSPMDYEIAGVYTNSLLDAYMEYKAMWIDIHKTSKEVEQRISGIHKQARSDKLIAYAKQAQDDYEKRMARYNAAKTELAKSPSLNSQLTLQEPMPNNKLEPYDADVFGLDQASRDCRYEMIKIVNEVNSVTTDPQVAVDPNRNFRYVSPAVFRMVLPTDKVPMPTLEEIDAMKNGLLKEIADAKADTLKVTAEKAQAEERSNGLQTQLNSTQAERDTARAENDNVRRERDYANTERDNARQERDTARSENQASWQQAQKATNEYSQLTKWVTSDKDIQIYQIIYGEKSLLQNQDVYNKVAQAIRDHSIVQMSNEFFCGDPKPGVAKDAVITYQYMGQKPVRLEQREGLNVEFKPGEPL